MKRQTLLIFLLVHLMSYLVLLHVILVILKKTTRMAVGLRRKLCSIMELSTTNLILCTFLLLKAVRFCQLHRLNPLVATLRMIFCFLFPALEDGMILLKNIIREKTKCYTVAMRQAFILLSHLLNIDFAFRGNCFSPQSRKLFL